MKKVVVIGGGFAGSTVARKLENEFDVTLVDNKEYFEFTPGMLRTIVEPEHIKIIQILHKDYLKRTKIIIGEVRDVWKDYIVIDKNKMEFDYLCICSGSKYSAPIKEQNLVMVTRAMHLKESYQKLVNANKVLIVGGGLVGIELAAEICTNYPEKEITIVHAKGKIMDRNHSKSIICAEKFLTKHRVRIIHNDMVLESRQNGKVYHTDKKREIETDIAFLCTGIISNFDFMKNNFNDKLNKKNQIIVNKYLQLQGVKNIFIAGDVNSISLEKTAQNAQKQARLVAENIFALENGKELKAYRNKKTPLVISLGKWNGIFESNSFMFSGIIPGLMKTFIEKREMWQLKYF